MQTPAGIWCAALIRDHLPALVDDMLQWARADNPREFPPDRATDHEQFTRFYSVLAQTLDTSDTQIARAIYERMAEERLRTKVPATAIIRLVDHGNEVLSQMIAAQQPDPALAAEATRQMRAVLATCRMILSKVNIQLLTHPDS